jgi:hypothetical protein
MRKIMKIYIHILLVLYCFLPFFSYSQSTDKKEKKSNLSAFLQNKDTTYSLPSDPQKLKPRFDETRLHFSLHRMIYNIWGPDYVIPPAMRSPEVGFENFRYFEAPKLTQVNFGYEIKPWIKVGVATHQRSSMSAKFFINRPEEPQMFGDAKMTVNFFRTWGIYMEFTPFPVKYLRQRRYELNFGGAWMRENIEIKREFTGGYNINLTTWRNFGKVKSDEISGNAFSVYANFSVFMLRWLSLESRVGYYIVPQIDLNPVEIILPTGYPNLNINSQPLDLSWNYYSLGFSLHL